jgi:D-alanyl-D-alanine dipeptidase
MGNRNSKYITKLNKHYTHIKPRHTMRTVLITTLCILAFFYVIGYFLDTETTEDDSNLADEQPSIILPTIPPTIQPPVDTAPQEEEPPMVADNSQQGSVLLFHSDFELPVEGATGYAPVELNMTETAGLPIVVVSVLPVGSAFRIIREVSDRWEIEYNGMTGWVRSTSCMINLPDIIPSIKYNCTNTYGSLFVSSGVVIPNITGVRLYSGSGYNERLGRSEFIVPVMYTMAAKICDAQRNALAGGDTLVIYEAFRPYGVQQRVAEALESLSRESSDVRRGINTGPWSLTWFISTGISNHQRGCAIDVSLARVDRREYATSGQFRYLTVPEFTFYEMFTPMHELSAAATIYTRAIDSGSATSWQNATWSQAMAGSEPAQALQRYCTDAGLTPLASEWWHFNDLETRAAVPSNNSGDFVLTECFSAVPVLADEL